MSATGVNTRTGDGTNVKDCLALSRELADSRTFSGHGNPRVFRPLSSCRVEGLSWNQSPSPVQSLEYRIRPVISEPWTRGEGGGWKGGDILRSGGRSLFERQHSLGNFPDYTRERLRTPNKSSMSARGVYKVRF